MTTLPASNLLTATPAPAPGLAACGQLLERVCRFAETGAPFDRAMALSSLQTVMYAAGKRHIDLTLADRMHRSPIAAVSALIVDLASHNTADPLFPFDDPVYEDLVQVALALGLDDELTTRTNVHAL